MEEDPDSNVEVEDSGGVQDDAPPPPPLPAPTQPPPEQPPAEQPPPKQLPAEQPPPEQPPPEQLPAEQPPPEQPPPEQPLPEQQLPEQLLPEQLLPEQPPPEQAQPEQPPSAQTPPPQPMSPADEESEEEQRFNLLDFSDDVLLNILRFCHARDLKALGYSCPRLAYLICDHTLWTHVDARSQPVGEDRLHWFMPLLNSGTIHLLLHGFAREAKLQEETRREVARNPPKLPDPRDNRPERSNDIELQTIDATNYGDEKAAAPPEIHPQDSPASPSRMQARGCNRAKPIFQLPIVETSPLSSMNIATAAMTITRSIMSRLVEQCPNLTVLCLDYCNIDCLKVKLSMFPTTLLKLSLVGSRCYNLPIEKSFLYRIHNHLPQLQEMDVSSCTWLAPSCLLPLSRLLHLDTLRARSCTMLAEFVAYASLATRYGFTKLRVLDVRYSPLADSEVSSLGWLPCLEELYLSALEEPPGEPYEPQEKLMDEWELYEPEFFRQADDGESSETESTSSSDTEGQQQTNNPNRGVSYEIFDTLDQDRCNVSVFTITVNHNRPERRTTANVLSLLSESERASLRENERLPLRRVEETPRVQRDPEESRRRAIAVAKMKARINAYRKRYQEMSEQDRANATDEDREAAETFRKLRENIDIMAAKLQRISELVDVEMVGHGRNNVDVGFNDRNMVNVEVHDRNVVNAASNDRNVVNAASNDRNVVNAASNDRNNENAASNDRNNENAASNDRNNENAASNDRNNENAASNDRNNENDNNESGDQTSKNDSDKKPNDDKGEDEDKKNEKKTNKKKTNEKKTETDEEKQRRIERKRRNYSYEEYLKAKNRRMENNGDADKNNRLVVNIARYIKGEPPYKKKKKRTCKKQRNNNQSRTSTVTSDNSEASTSRSELSGYNFGASTSTSGPSTSYSTPGPSHSAAGPSHSAAGPSHSAAGPSHSAAGPSHSAAGPSHSAAGPSHSAAGTSGSTPSTSRNEASTSRPNENIKYVKFRQNRPPILVEQPEELNRPTYEHRCHHLERGRANNDDVILVPDGPLICVDLGRPQPRTYQVTVSNERLQENLRGSRPRMLNMIRNIFYTPPHVSEPDSLITDVAIRHFGRENNQDIINVGPNGALMRGCPEANRGRPKKSKLKKLVCTGYNGITNTSLVHLAEAAPDIVFIDFSGTRVNEEGVNSFKLLRPDCEVIYDNNGPDDDDDEDDDDEDDDE